MSCTIHVRHNEMDHDSNHFIHSSLFQPMSIPMPVSISRQYVCSPVQCACLIAAQGSVTGIHTGLLKMFSDVQIDTEGILALQPNSLPMNLTITEKDLN